MSVTLKIRDKSKIPKKVLIYGRPGHGKSTFAKKYCEERGMTPCIIDFDDTNFTGDDIADINQKTHLLAYNTSLKAIKDIIADEKYDTVIIDGLGRLLNDIVSKRKGNLKYLDRSDRFNEMFDELVNSKKHLIFIGQEDTNLENYNEKLPNQSIIKVNSIVNEIYYCIKDNNGKFTHSVDKYRKELDEPNIAEETSKSEINEQLKKENEKRSNKPKNTNEINQDKAQDVKEKTAVEKAIEDKEKRDKEKSEDEKVVLFIAEDFEEIPEEQLATTVINRTKDHLEATTGESDIKAVRTIIKTHKDELNVIKNALADECMKLLVNQGK